MKRPAYPKPILDEREQALIAALQKEFEDFTKPGVINRALKKLTDLAGDVIPNASKKAFADATSAAGQWELIQKTLQIAEKGFHHLTQQASRMTVSQAGVVEKLSVGGPTISTFNEICLLRSYDIEAVIEEKTYQDTLLALAEGAATGFFGLPGVPFNLALSFFLYFRAVQSVALHYGYDVKADPRELQIAAEVTMQSLDPKFSGSGLGGLIGKMMLSAELSELKQSLGRFTYTAMAQRGGSELLYVQIRAFANEAAKEALTKAGEEALEVGVFKSLLAQLAKRMPKEAGKKSLPVIGALIGGLSDAYLMGRILRGAKLIYHKRYLFEKEYRVFLVKKSGASRRSSQIKATGVHKAPRSSKRTKPKTTRSVKRAIRPATSKPTPIAKSPSKSVKTSKPPSPGSRRNRGGG